MRVLLSMSINFLAIMISRGAPNFLATISAVTNPPREIPNTRRLAFSSLGITSFRDSPKISEPKTVVDKAVDYNVTQRVTTLHTNIHKIIPDIRIDKHSLHIKLDYLSSTEKSLIVR